MIGLLISAAILIVLLQVFLDEETSILDGVIISLITGVAGGVAQALIGSMTGDSPAGKFIAFLLGAIVSVAILGIIISWWKGAGIKISLIISAIYFAATLVIGVVFLLLLSEI